MFYIQGNNIEMTRGDTLHAVINMRDPLGVISYPETGDVVTFNAMLTRDGEAVITKTIPHDTMTLTLDPEDTEELAYGRYIFTVKIVRAGGDVDTFIDDGTLTLVKTWRHKPHDAYVPWNPWIPLNSMNGWLAPGGAAPVDAALNISSTHPVQNKALYQALAGKVDNVEGMGLSHNDLTDALAQKLTDIEAGATKVIVDALFVSGSTNPVQSKTIQAALAAKVDKEVGKGLSSNDYTSAEKEKLSGIEAGAQVNPDLSGYATRSEMNTALAGKADSSSVHNVPAGGTAGQVLKKRSGTDYDAEWAEESGLDGKIDDVRINGSSIVSSGIANIPKASVSNFGVAKVYAYGDPPVRMVKLENSGNGAFSVPMLDGNGYIRIAVLPEATTSAKGAMSASDKSKLDGIEAEANKTTVDSALSATSTNPVQNKVVKVALDGKADVSALATKADVSALATKADVSALAGKADISELEGKADVSALASKADVSALNAKEDKVTEVAVSAAGAVSQTLEAGKWYHFTGALTSLTITLTTPASGELAQYHFDFISGATAPTLTLPDSVKMPDSFSVEANKRYEVDILNNYGAVMTWAIS